MKNNMNAVAGEDSSAVSCSNMATICLNCCVECLMNCNSCIKAYDLNSTSMSYSNKMDNNNPISDYSKVHSISSEKSIIYKQTNNNMNAVTLSPARNASAVLDLSDADHDMDEEVSTSFSIDTYISRTIGTTKSIEEDDKSSGKCSTTLESTSSHASSPNSLSTPLSFSFGNHPEIVLGRTLTESLVNLNSIASNTPFVMVQNTAAQNPTSISWSMTSASGLSPSPVLSRDASSAFTPNGSDGLTNSFGFPVLSHLPSFSS
jgi:hypothetical protein